jgi:pyruvate-formate lyase-activating enzyme
MDVLTLYRRLRGQEAKPPGPPAIQAEPAPRPSLPAAGAFPLILIDIVGGCNAKCPFCVTGREDFGKPISPISVTDFERTLDRLIEIQLAIPGTTDIALFNWGEPSLHRDLDGILRAINARDLNVRISTNASKAIRFTEPTNRFTDFIFSVPGWSQNSYDRIHGLRFDRVVANMEATITNVREMGYAGPIRLCFHVYQFNYSDEFKQARDWCVSRNVTFFPVYAQINDYRQWKAYLTGTMSPKDLSDVSRSLFLHYVDEVISQQPADWTCPQWTRDLTLNHKAEVLLCCSLPLDHPEAVLGSVFSLSREQIVTGKVSAKECDACIGSGANYCGYNPPTVPTLI